MTNTQTRPLLLAALLAWPLGCNKEDVTSEIPDALRGAYGRRDEDAFFPTLGLEVDVDTLRFSELTVKILSGKEVNGGTFQIAEAELRWAKDEKEPRKCKGSIARQGSRLLLTLFKAEGEGKCDSTLDGEWEAWAPIDAIPKTMQGAYGRKDPYANAEGLFLKDMSIIAASSGEELELEQAIMFESRPNHLIVRRGKFGSSICQGYINLVEDHLEGNLEAHADAGEDAGWCPRVFGNRWSVDPSSFPKTRIDNGTVSLEVRGEAVVLKTLDDQNLKCEQTILRTASRNVAQSGRDGVPVMGGTVLVLRPSEPSSGAQACADRLGGLAEAQCEQLLGTSCDASMLAAVADTAEDVQCPSHIIIGDPEAGGRKIALLPHDLSNAVCWETREPLKAKE